MGEGECKFNIHLVRLEERGKILLVLRNSTITQVGMNRSLFFSLGFLWLKASLKSIWLDWKTWKIGVNI